MRILGTVVTAPYTASVMVEYQPFNINPSVGTYKNTNQM